MPEARIVILCALGKHIMIVAYRLRTAVALTVILALTLGVLPALAQQITDAQRSAIRSSCRSDFMSNCSGVQPGGAAAFQCLQQNMTRLSAACQSAVSAVTPQEAPKPPPAPKAEALKPAPAEAPKAGPAPEKAEAASAKELAPSAAPKAAAGSPSKPATAKPKPAALATKSAVSSAPQAVAAPPMPPLVLRPLRPREEVRVLRLACGDDARTLCNAVQPGGGRIIQCLATHPGALSAGCREVLGQFAAQ